MCKDVFNSSEFNKASSILFDFGMISVINRALVSLYNLDIDFKPNEIKNLHKKIQEEESVCLDLKNNISDSKDCMNLCNQIIPFNKPIMSFYTIDQSVFTILIEDYFTTKELYNIEKNLVTQDVWDMEKSNKNEILKRMNSKIEEKDTENAVIDFKNEINVYLFLPPYDLNHELNLNKMNIKYSTTLWYISKTRFIDWGLNLNLSLIHI